MAEASILTLEQRKKLTLTGVESVDAVTESEIALTVEGSKLRLSGSKLKVLSFNSGSGSFLAVGEFHTLRYGARRGRGLKGLFK